MGLLDDAIRDHLELKRRAGADAGEVEALEHEALGPVRREEASPESEAPSEPAPEVEQREPTVDAEAPAQPAPAPLEQPTEAFSLDELVDAGARQDPEPTEDDDVLDQTPEFLQETPEHDRLWFEQKPPRDFDF